MKKEIKDYLHLYYGCEAHVVMAENTESELPYYFSKDGIYKIDGVMIDFQRECASIKPILRPLSDMTEEELKNLRSERGHLKGVERADLDYIIRLNRWSPEDVHYLLSKHFDLFGLIEAGLAIDKTTFAL